MTKIDKQRQKVTKTAPTFCHVLPYNSVFVNFDKNRQKIDFVASILSNSTKSDKTIIVAKPPYSTKQSLWSSHHKKTFMMESMMNLPDDMFRQELLPYLTVKDIVKLDSACNVSTLYIVFCKFKFKL